MIKVELERIKPRYFAGYVYREQLPPKLQRMFTGDTVDVEGCYSIEWDKDIAMPVIDGPLLLFQYVTKKDGTKDMIFANLDDKTADFKSIIKEIIATDHYHQWLSDMNDSGPE